MSFQIESGICSGRSFSASGFMGKFKTWVVKTPASGGPGWFIIDDQSALGTDPYILISDVAVPTANGYNNGQNGGAQKILKVGYVTANSGQVLFEPYCGYSGGTPYAPWGYSGLYGRVDVLDSTDFAYDFRGGSECMMIFSRVGTVTKYGILTEFTGITGITEPANAVTDITTGVTGGATSEEIIVTATANFTVDKIYRLYDFTAHNWCAAVKVTAIADGTHMTVEDISGTNLDAFPIGAIIGTYPHKQTLLLNSYSIRTIIPYYTIEYHEAYNKPYMTNGLQKTLLVGFGNPQQSGDTWAASELFVQEDEASTQSASYDGNTLQGILTNIRDTGDMTGTNWYDGLTIGSNNWVIFDYTVDYLVLNTESV